MQGSTGREVVSAGARIAGIVSCVPSKVLENDYFSDQFGADAVADVVKMIGVKSRRWVDPATSTRDLCAAAGQKLLAGLGWEADTVDAVIFVSQTPDYRLPATACVLQDLLGIPPGCIAFDINLGCSGYPYALWLGMSMIQTRAAKRVLLAVGDTISKIVDPSDRATAMLFGDAGTVTALEAGEGSNTCFVLGSDGRGATNLIVPTGAYKDYGLAGDPRLASRNPECLYMDGGEIFNFTLRAVPGLVQKTLELGGLEGRGEHDFYLFHQANLFMLKHLVKKTKLPAEKAPFNIEEFGNTSSASIPLLMTSRLQDALRNGPCRIAMFGFGVGYSWASASIDVGPLKIVETITL